MKSTPASEVGTFRRGEQRAVHVGVAARLEHQRGAQMIAVLLDPGPLLEHGLPLDGGKAVDDEPQRLAGGVGVEGADDHGGDHTKTRFRVQGSRFRGRFSGSGFGSRFRVGGCRFEWRRRRWRERSAASRLDAGADYDRTACDACPVEELTRAAVLSEADVRAVLTMPDLIEAMEAALDRLLVGRRRSAAAHGAPGRRRQGVLRGDAGLGPGRDALGTKLVTVYESNAARGLPSHLATIVLLDPATGALRAIVDGRYITEARTAAVSAVVHAAAGAAGRRRPRADRIRRAGAQPPGGAGAASARCARCACGARIPSRRAGVRRIGRARACPVRAVGSAREAVDGADLVALVSAARQPVVTR